MPPIEPTVSPEGDPDALADESDPFEFLEAYEPPTDVVALRRYVRDGGGLDGPAGRKLRSALEADEVVDERLLLQTLDEFQFSRLAALAGESDAAEERDFLALRLAHVLIALGLVSDLRPAGRAVGGQWPEGPRLDGVQLRMLLRRISDAGQWRAVVARLRGTPQSAEASAVSEAIGAIHRRTAWEILAAPFDDSIEGSSQ